MTRLGWLVAVVLIAPLAVLPASMGLDLMAAKNAVFSALALAGLVWLVPSWWLRAFLVWAVVCLVESGVKGWGVSGLLGIIGWLLIYRTATRLTESQWVILRRAITAAALMQLVWMGVQALNLDPLFVPLPTQAGVLTTRNLVTGFFANPMDTSLFLGLTLPAVAAVSPWLVLPVAVAIVVLGSTVGIVGVVVTVCWLGFPHIQGAVARLPQWAMRAALAGFVMVVMIGGLAAYTYAFDPQGLGMRPMVWARLVDAIRAHPILGWGPNALDYRMVIVTPATALRWPFGFNEYLQGAAEFGLPGLALALGFVGSLVWRLRGRWTLAGELLPALVILLLVAGFSIPFRVGPAALLGALYLGRLSGRLV